MPRKNLYMPALQSLAACWLRLAGCVTEKGKMTKLQEKRITEDYARMYIALRRISAYQSPERLRRSSEKEWGLSADEAIEAAYENVIQEAKDGLRGIYKPKPKSATGERL